MGLDNDAYQISDEFCWAELLKAKCHIVVVPLSLPVSTCVSSLTVRIHKN